MVAPAWQQSINVNLLEHLKEETLETLGYTGRLKEIWLSVFMGESNTVCYKSPVLVLRLDFSLAVCYSSSYTVIIVVIIVIR